MANNIEICRKCRYKTLDHYCTHPQTQDRDGKPCLARHVWYVSYNARGDYFAAAAMQGWIASFDPHSRHPADYDGGAERVSIISYALADAMIAEREDQ
jgi:hypothetical protein